MVALIRAELRKYLSTRMVWGMGLAMFLTGAGFAALFGAFMIYGEIGGPGGATIEPTAVLPELTLARIIYTAGISLGYLLALCIGILSIGQEFRHKTATSTFLAAPRRHRVIGAKSAALVLIAAGNGVAHVLGALLGGGILLAINGLAVFPEPVDLLRTLALVLLVLGLWALMGLGVGVLIPNQVAALFIAVAVAWIVEPLLGFALTFVSWGEGMARFFPSQATTATLDLSSGMDAATSEMMGMAGDPLTWWAGALVLVGYAVVLAGVGLVLTRRRDIA